MTTETSDPTPSKRAGVRARRKARVARRETFFDLMASGFSCERIAAEAKVSAATVRREVDRAIAEQRLDAPERYAHLQVARLNKALRVADGSIEKGDLKAVGPFLRLVAALDRYHGLGPRRAAQAPAAAQPPADIYRTQLFNPADIDNVIKVQDGYKVETLSAYLKQPAPLAAAPINFPKFDKELAKTEFFEFLDFALQFAPPQPNDVDIRAKLGSIGVGQEKTFSFKDLSAEDKIEVALGMKEGARKIDEAIASAGRNVNGWRVGGLAGGDSAFYNGDWLKRAAVAKGGIYANSPQEATYPFTRVDAEGETLDGSGRAYTLTFGRDSLPPVNAFWSVTMYDGKTQLLIENPINRYLINSPMWPEMKKNPDGSLTIYIQSQSPGADRQANWLPAPDGPMYLVMRLYWPKTTPPSILLAGEGSWRPPGVVRTP
jgi:hypothetical protein